MENVQLTDFQPQHLNITKEAHEILVSKSLRISPTAKYKYEQSFLKYLELKRLLGNYMLPLGAISALIVGITVFLFLYLFDVNKYWMYILLITCGIILIVLVAGVGWCWKRGSKSLKRRQMNSWIGRRFGMWSLREIEAEANCNKKRYLIENMINLLPKFTTNDPDSRQAARNQEMLERVLSDPRNQAALFLSCILFKKVFRSAEGVYVEAGRTFATAVLLPFLRHTLDGDLRRETSIILEEFYRDTNIDVKMSALNVGFIDPEEKVLLERNKLASTTCGAVLYDCEFFEDIWKIDEEFFSLFRKEFYPELPSESPELTYPSNVLRDLTNDSATHNGTSKLLPVSQLLPRDSAAPQDDQARPESNPPPPQTITSARTIPTCPAPQSLRVLTDDVPAPKNSSGKSAECSFNKCALSSIKDGRVGESQKSLRTVEDLEGDLHFETPVKLGRVVDADSGLLAKNWFQKKPEPYH